MKAYVGLGSNLGDRLKNIKSAIDEISRIQGVQSLRLSSIYETEPVQCEGEWFYNAVLEIETRLDPVWLMQKFLEIEKTLGRIPLKKGHERSIDLDLLLCEGQIVEKPILTLPHPRFHLRRFVLEPLCELNKGLVHPRLGQTLERLLQDLKDDAVVKKAIPIYSSHGGLALI
jgi:2-amino-4-hydroxy-6-hydroxymethyldihydropteridine diphosphokinase